MTMVLTPTPIPELEQQLAAKRARLAELRQTFVLLGPGSLDASSAPGASPPVARPGVARRHPTVAAAGARPARRGPRAGARPAHGPVRAHRPRELAAAGGGR